MNNQIADNVFSLLKGYGFKISVFDEDGNETIDPALGRNFFVTSPNFMVTIGDDGITVNKGMGVDFDKSEDLMRCIRKIADGYLVNTNIKVFSKSIQPRDFSFKAKMMRESLMVAPLLEGFTRLVGTKKTSSQSLGEVKILIRHSSPVMEELRGSRSRDIKEIYIDRDGERVKLPFTHLLGARAMAQHIAHGGSISDDMGNHITDRVSDIIRISEFRRYVASNRLINEQNSSILEKIKQYSTTTKDELKKLASRRYYGMVKDRIHTGPLTQCDVSDLRELFTVKHFDDSLEPVLPIIAHVMSSNAPSLGELIDSSEQPVYINEPDCVAPVRYTDDMAEVGNRMIELSTCILHNDKLASFIYEVGNKILGQHPIDKFDISIVESTLHNVTYI